jgi:hypothetical protein
VTRRHVATSALGVLAWLTTVFPLVVASTVSVWCKMAGILSLLSLVAAVLIRRGARSGVRRAGIGLFLIGAIACWLLAGPSLSGVDPFAGFVGAVAWAAFAAAWPEPWTIPEGELSLAPEADTRDLEPRRRLGLFTYGLVAVAALSSAVSMWLGWQVGRADRGVLAHVLAVAAAVGLLSVSAAVTVAALESHEPLEASSRWRRPVVSSLLWMFLALLLAVLWVRLG